MSAGIYNTPQGRTIPHDVSLSFFYLLLKTTDERPVLFLIEQHGLTIT
jgi:hypothetical protein